MIELLKQWSELEPEKCSPAEAGSVFRLSYNLQNGHYIDSNNLSNEILAIIQRCVQNAIIARNWPFDLSFGSYGYKAWIQAEFGNPAYAEATGIVECLLSAYIKALRMNKPTRFEGVVSIEDGFVNIVRGGQGYSVPIPQEGVPVEPKKLELIKTVYVPKNEALECRCVHGCIVKFDVIPFVITPKAFGECEHFRYVMLLDEDSQNER
jgi:hypothetical protein